jgi:hypothetical protein
MDNISTFSYPSWAISPQTNLAAELVMGAGALASLIYCIHIARRDRVVWPLWMFIGAGVMTIWETIVNLFEHIAYPSEGARIILDGWLGRDIPLYCFLIYLCYFAGPGAWLYQRILGGVSRSELTRIAAITIIACATFEPIAVYFNLWTYYGTHPFNWTGLPMHWWFSNAVTVLFVPAACAMLRKHVLTCDAQTFIFVPFMIMACWTSKSIDMPIIFAFYATTDIVWLSVASLATMALALLAMSGIIRAVSIR